VRKAISDYDRELPTAVNILRRRSKTTKDNNNNNNNDNDNNNNNNNNDNDSISDSESDSFHNSNSSNSGNKNNNNSNSGSNIDNGNNKKNSSCINSNSNNNTDSDDYDSEDDRELSHIVNMSDGPKVGMCVKTYFSKSGWYKGYISTIIINEITKICVKFEDGEKEEWSMDDYNKYASEASINIGDVGYKFVKVWTRGPDSEAFDGIITNITAMGNRQCQFNDGRNYTYDLDSIKKFSKIQYIQRYSDDGDDSDDSNDSNDVRGNDNGYDNGKHGTTFDSESDNDSLKSIGNDTDDSDDDSIVETISNGIYLTKLLRIPLDELEARE